MATKIAVTDKRAALTAKVASMTEEQKLSRIEQLHAMPGPADEDREIEYAVFVEHTQPSLEASFVSKVASMTPAERVARREQIADAAPSWAGDLEFCCLTNRYHEDGRPFKSQALK